MSSFFESRMMLKMSEPFRDFSKQLEPLFPQMEWNLKRAGYRVESDQYISIILYTTLFTFILSMSITAIPFIVVNGLHEAQTGIVFSIIATAFILTYQLLIPNVMIRRRSLSIDKDLEYMLKDIQIQLSSGVPLFDTLVNIARGDYGECSQIAGGIIQEVEQGKSITEVLEDVGMWSPSIHLRKTLWQIVNAVKSGSDVVESLDAISQDIRSEKENAIKAYGKELNLYGLIYMMMGIVVPSMGVTLLVILSSFIGKTFINEQLFIVLLFAMIVFHVMFITFVKSKRPQI
ncbi:type II secretion system F family protein [Candidatus Altiarchaeota archaeon]